MENKGKIRYFTGRVIDLFKSAKTNINSEQVANGLLGRRLNKIVQKGAYDVFNVQNGGRHEASGMVVMLIGSERK